MKISRFMLSQELLHAALKLPATATIVDISKSCDSRYATFEIRVVDPSFDDVPESCVIPLVVPELKTEKKECGCEQVAWSWGKGVKSDG